MPENTFSRSIAAQNAGRCVIDAARKSGLLDKPVAVAPEFAESEKKLLIKILAEIKGKESFSTDEIASLFNFVFAKSAETVTNFANHRPDEFDLMGLLDGKAPICAEEKLTDRFKRSDFAGNAAQNFWDFMQSADAPADEEKFFALAEALKWCFRLGCHYAVTILEENHYVFV